MLTFMQNGALQWGHSDLLAVGHDAQFARIAEMSAYFSIRGDKQGGRMAAAVWLILPPWVSENEENAFEQLRLGVHATLTKISNGTASEKIREEAFSFLSPQIMPSYDGDALVRLLSSAPAKTGVIVAEAGRYRLSRTKIPAGSQLEETLRTAHLHQLLVEVDALCQANNCYVALDSGFLAPLRQDDLDLLQSVGDAGFVSGVPTDEKLPDPENIIEDVSRWTDAVKAGQIGSVIAEINADTSLSDRQRFFLKLEFFSTAGIHDQTRGLLRDSPHMLVEPPVQQALAIARISEEADDDDFAESLIFQCLPRIRNEEDFRSALTTSLQLRSQALRSAVVQAYRRFHPNALALKRLGVLEAARAGRYDEAAAGLASIPDAHATEEARLYGLLADGTRNRNWDPHAAHAMVVREMPHLAGDAGVEIALQLDRHGRRSESCNFLFKRGENLTSRELLVLIRLAGTAIQAATMPSSDPLVEKIMDRAIAYLASHPDDGSVRTRLAHLLGPTMTATHGVAMLVTALLKRADKRHAIHKRPKVVDRPFPIPADDTKPYLERIWTWLREKGHGMWIVGQHTLPADMLDVSADRLIAAILLQVDYAGNRIADENDLNLLNLYMAAASAIAPLADEPDEDLTVARTVGGKLALAGKGQAARDVAEFVVVDSGKRPERHRQALFSFADIYARVGMRIEAMVALAAALETGATTSWDQIWFETNLLFRLLRDAGMAKLALPYLERSHQALEEIGIADRDGYRLETMALQATTAAFDSEGSSDEQLAGLIKAARANAEVVLDRDDDLLPVAMVLNRLIHMGSSRGLTAVAPAEQLLERLLGAIPEAQRPMIRAAGRSPTLADIAAVARNIDDARYAADVGYDLRNLRVMTRTLIGNAVTDVEPEALIYAVEASADRAILVQTADGKPVQTERLLSREDAPYEAALELSELGAGIVGMAMFESRLATIEFEDGKISDVTLEENENFSAAALQRWSKRFPKDYSLDALSRDEMRASVMDLGVTKLPKRSIVVEDARLQRFPPNLLTIKGNYAGFDHAIGITPSLEWLMASRRLDRKGNGSARMWIPTSPPSDEPGPLTLMADEVAPELTSHSVVLERGEQPSAEFADTDVAIIGAHGGLAEVNRYFRSLSNDSHGVTEIAQVAEITRKARLTILFVCSGGRIDPHPETGMAIGLAKQILARGSAAVIGPAWPIPFFVAQPWLAGFFAAWRTGAMALDACHSANLHVARLTSWDPKRALAMSVYGDPFIRHDDS
ncbi:hypothetical protein ACC808_22105 [Rhizobium ruizarguesonis]